MDIIKESGGWWWWWWGFWYSGRGRWMIWDQCLLCWSLQGSNQRMEEVRTMSFYRNLQAKFSASQQQVVQISKVLLSFLCVWHICLQSRSKMICSRCKKVFHHHHFFFRAHHESWSSIHYIQHTQRDTNEAHCCGGGQSCEDQQISLSAVWSWTVPCVAFTVETAVL